MKRLLILTILGMLLSGAAGCRFMECLWRGGPCQQTKDERDQCVCFHAFTLDAPRCRTSYRMTLHSMPGDQKYL